MKSNKQKAGLMALVALAAIGSYFIAGTYAKYISEISGSGTATVAKWKWKINNTDITSSATNTFTFNLLETVKDSDGTSSESDVASGLLAPGMTGEFTIDITNNSEVNANYAINFSESSSNCCAASFCCFEASLNFPFWVLFSAFCWLSSIFFSCSLSTLKSMFSSICL